MKRILIVDDEELILTALKKAVSGPGVEVRLAKTAEGAIEKIRSNAFQLCFLDVNLPDRSGLEVLEIIREVSPETRVVVISSSVLNGEKKRLIEDKAHLFVPKPFDLLNVRMVVRHIFAGINHVAEAGVSSREKPWERQRRFQRRSVSEPVFCLVRGESPRGSERIEAKTFDVSDGGVGVETNYPLHPGQSLALVRDDGEREGVVRWSLVGNDSCRVGIEFL